MTSTERSSRTVSPLLLPRELSTYRPTIDYEELSQENAGSSVEWSPPSTGRQPVTLRRINFERSRLPGLCLVVLVSTTVLYMLSAALHIQRFNDVTSARPIKIHFKDGSLRNSEVECDTPLQIVADEADAHVVIWSSPKTNVNISEYDGEKARRERPGQLHGFWSLESAEYYPQIKRARQQLVMKDPKAFDFEARRQDKIAAAFISNCDPLNNRTQILQQLIDLLPGQIDSFGQCLNNAKSDEFVQQFNLNPLTNGQPQHKLSRWEEKMSIIQGYKFTIAFENSNDEDYVTEKYYQALEAGSIPIHLGQTPEQFEKFKPSTNSTLNVADFKTVEALADRIKQIAMIVSHLSPCWRGKTSNFLKDLKKYWVTESYTKLAGSPNSSGESGGTLTHQSGAIRFILSTIEFKWGITSTVESQRPPNLKRKYVVVSGTSKL
ncbi:hypothetical protein KEM48_006173 [Puccinia striiformis f. sp. tritici PST-130]|nr:hypothetical protein KEM48_006173 [Puccinia striiformis f. sp. tritici PST-130]